MNNVDPDILFALKTLAADGEAQRVLGLQAKYAKTTEERFNTQMQLLADDVARVCPRSHPLFDLVLILAVARKVERSQQEPEFIPDFERGFPAGW